MSTVWGIHKGVHVTADKVLNGDVDQFCSTKRGVGQFWQADFGGLTKKVTEVKILNRSDEQGDHLANAAIQIDEEFFGAVPKLTVEG